MRNLLILIALGVLGYFGWRTWQTHPEYFARFLPQQAPPAPATPDASNDVTPTGVPAQIPVAPTPAPRQFASKIAVDTPNMPPGKFLVLERTSVETKTGVIAIVPGDVVTLVERRKDGTLRVSDGHNDFEVMDTQVTQDVAAARAAERRDFEKHYGGLR